MNHYTSFFRRGNKVYIRELVQGQTEREMRTIDYMPYLYIPCSESESNTKYKNLAGQHLKEVQFQSISSLRAYTDSVNGSLYGYPRHEYACVDNEYPTEEITYNFNDLRVVYLDIEVNSDTHYSSVENPDQAVILMQLQMGEMCYILGTKFYESYDDKLIYIQCKDEVDMLKKFVRLFRKLDPDIISGWNSSGYDIPYLKTRCDMLEIPDVFKRLSPFNQINESDEIVFGKPQLRVELMGIQHLDYIHLIKKFDLKKYENYKLGTVAQEILKKTKVEFEGSLSDLYVTDYNEFVRYGLVDTQLVKEIEDEKNLIQLVVMVAYMDKVNFVDSYSQVRMWDNKFMVYLKHHYNVQVPYVIAKESSDFEEEEEGKFEGAYVFEPIPKKYSNIMSDDVQSLYPSIIIASNASPETYRGNHDKNVEFFLQDQTEYQKYLKENDYSSLANGSVFSRKKQGFVPEIIDSVFRMRVKAKEVMTQAKKDAAVIEKELQKRGVHLEFSSKTDIELKAMLVDLYTIASINKIKQNALKVKINSAYGALGNPYFRFYQRDIAEGITLTGQTLLKTVIPQLNILLEKFHSDANWAKVIYGDTDSIYYSLDGVVQKYVPATATIEERVEFMDRFHKKYIQPVIAMHTQSLHDKLNVFENRLKFVRDVIADTGIFLAKKRYMLQVWDAEGVRYAEPEQKLMGIDAVKSSTPKYCREKIKQAIDIMFNHNNDELIDFLVATEREFKKLPVEQIAFPRGISDIEKYTIESAANDFFGDENDATIEAKKGCPIHVKASIFHNKLLMEKGLDTRVPLITNGDKIKFCYLKNPNPIANNSIAFDDKLPVEFGLHKYLDYKLQYEKSFLDGIKAITNVIGWTTERNNALF